MSASYVSEFCIACIKVRLASSSRMAGCGWVQKRKMARDGLAKSNAGSRLLAYSDQTWLLKDRIFRVGSKWNTYSGACSDMTSLSLRGLKFLRERRCLSLCQFVSPLLPTERFHNGPAETVCSHLQPEKDPEGNLDTLWHGGFAFTVAVPLVEASIYLHICNRSEPRLDQVAARKEREVTHIGEPVSQCRRRYVCIGRQSAHAV